MLILETPLHQQDPRPKVEGLWIIHPKVRFAPVSYGNRSGRGYWSSYPYYEGQQQPLHLLTL